MTLTLDQRRERDLLKARIREIEDPERQEKRARHRQAQREHRKAVHDSAAPNKRQPRQHDKFYLAHVRQQPCMLAGLEGETCAGRIDPAHLRYANLKVGRPNPGMGAKSGDRWVLPLCRKHHDEQHAHGNEARWWAGKGINPDHQCLHRYAEFSKGKQQ